jgi:hypothetical protein
VTPSRLLPHLLAALLVMAVFAGPLAAREPSAQERAGIADRIARFDQQVRSGDLAGIVGIMPPTLKRLMATKFNVPAAGIDAAMIAVMTPLMATVTVEDFKIDLAQAEYRLTPDGQRFYALIPTQTRMTIQKTTKIETKSRTLALVDEGAWYLVRLDQPQQIGMFKEAFPEFAAVEFPAGEIRQLD